MRQHDRDAVAVELPQDLSRYNARDHVARPEVTEVSFVDSMADDTTLTFAPDADLDGMTVSLEWGEQGEPRHQLLSAWLDIEQIAELYERIIGPFMAANAEAERLARLAEERHEREEAADKAARQEYEQAAAFLVQTLERPRGMSWTLGEPHRLHRSGCTVPGRARAGKTTAYTLEDLLAKFLPSVRDRFEQATSAPSIEHNMRRVRRAAQGYQRDVALETSVLSLCGSCKPLGDRTKDVNAELARLANKTTADPEMMVRVAQALVEIEQAADKIDAKHQQQRRESE